MEITKEFLQQELASLTQQRDKVLADANALSGAIQMVEVLLKKTEEDPPEETEEKEIFSLADIITDAKTRAD